MHVDYLGGSGRVPEEFLDFGAVAAGEAVRVRAVIASERASRTHLAVGANAAKRAWLDGREVALDGRGYLACGPVELAAGETVLELRLTATEDVARAARALRVRRRRRGLRATRVPARRGRRRRRARSSRSAPASRCPRTRPRPKCWWGRTARPACSSTASRSAARAASTPTPRSTRTACSRTSSRSSCARASTSCGSSCSTSAARGPPRSWTVSSRPRPEPCRCGRAKPGRCRATGARSRSTSGSTSTAIPPTTMRGSVRIRFRTAPGWSRAGPASRRSP